MARYIKQGSAQSSPDSVLTFSASAASPNQQAYLFDAIPVPVMQPAEDEELLDIWDNIWFGVSSYPAQPLISRPKQFLADPLANVIPIISVPVVLQQQQQQQQQQQAILAAQMQQQPVLAQMQQHPLLAVQEVAEQQQLLRLTQTDSSLQPTFAGGKSLAAAVPSLLRPGQPAGEAEAGTVAPASRNSKSIFLPDHQQQGAGETEQHPAAPAPYVLGTWAQRQFIMPVHKDNSKQQADAAAAGAAPGTSLSKPIPANGTSRRSGSTASGGSGGSSGRAAAAGAADEEGGIGKVHGSNAAAVAAAAAAAAAVDAAMGGRRSIGTDEEEEAVTQAAWRWRFAKRWQAEQTRAPLDPAASVGDGGMEEALQYLAACGENWHLARATSADVAGGTVESRLLGTLGTPSLLGAEGLLVDEGSYSAHGSGRGGLLQSTGSGGLGGYLSREVSHSGGAGRGEATQQVTGITKRAAQLLAAQSDINKAVQQRWQTVQASELWVGALLESVEVDDWGKYKFLLLRLRDRSGRQKLLVRGANYASDAKIVEGLHRQMMGACAAHDVCAEAIEVIGGGVMEWRRHRDRHLHISGGYVAPASAPGGPSTPAEVMNLAAVLTKQHLPMHYKVTSDGGKAL